MMAKPFLKWAGGKTQLIDKIDDVFINMKINDDSFIYAEPFLGGGSVLLHVLDNYSNCEFAIVNDLNKELINLYRVIASDDLYTKFKERLRQEQELYNNSNDKLSYYNNVRCLYNKWMSEYDGLVLSVDGAVWFLFLNKCCFNGLYRVSKKSGFNVPWGQKDYLRLYDEDYLDHCHALLSDKVIFMTGDYKATRTALDMGHVMRMNVVFYMDPPYKPITKTQAFTSYTVDGFDDKDQEQLKLFCDEIHNNGACFVMSNSCVDDYFDKLYNDYTVTTVKAKRNINSDGNKRGEVDEVLIFNRIEDYEQSKEIPLF
jgi:DNA adenine methylase